MGRLTVDADLRAAGKKISIFKRDCKIINGKTD